MKNKNNTLQCRFKVHKNNKANFLDKLTKGFYSMVLSWCIG